MDLKTVISRYGKYILLGLISLLILIAVYRGCQVQTLRDEYNALKGQYDVLKKQADVALKQALEYIKAQDARITEQNKLIELKDKEIAEKYGNIDSLNGKLSKLEEAYSGLVDAPAKIANLQSQVNIYKQKCLSFESVILDKDVQLRAWEVKFIAQVGISETWKKQYEAEHALRLVADEALKVQEKRVRSLSFSGNFKNVVILAVGGYLAYDLIKGK